MTRHRVVIDASNVFGGGGAQAAASFVDELHGMRESTEHVRRYPWLEDVDVRVSSAVLDNLHRPRTTYVRSERAPRPWSRRRTGGDFADVVFEVFGPVYRAIPGRRRITGFADGTSVLPEHANARGARARTRLAVRSRVSRFCFRRADRLVVESPFMAGVLARRWGWSPASITTVPNVLNSGFVRSLDLPAAPEVPQDVPTFCYITRAYPHKNLEVLGPAAEHLRRRWDVDVKWVLTLTAAEFAALSTSTRRASINVGPVAVDQLGSIYRACTGTVFTSLLETFSVTPLEAMAAGSSLVASDRDFVRDVAGEAAFYVDPLSPESVAAGVNAVLEDADRRARRQEFGLRTMERWPDARARAVAYADLIDAELHT